MNKSTPINRSFQIRKRGLRALLGLALAIGLTGLGWLLLPCPDLYGTTSFSTAWLDRNGRLLRLDLAADERYRLKIPLASVAPLMQEATLLYEDQNFYQHSGVDLFALLRAGWQTYLLNQRKVGGSTLTMQVARLRYGHSHDLVGKLQQIFRALQIERHYSKAEILAAYFNLASYGRNIEGIEAASLIYFDKPASELTLPEAMALSVVPQNPVRRNPTSATGFKTLVQARERLYSRWLEIHPKDSTRRAQIELTLAVRPPEKMPFRAPHFVNGLQGGPGRVITTLNLNTQSVLESSLTDYVKRHREKGIHNAAALLLNSRSMEVEALVGSANFFDNTIAGQVNGTTAKRSPGSALKPFVYALALDQGLIHPMTLLKDSPSRFGAYTPENFDQSFLGPVLAQDALILSRNVPAVNLTAALRNGGLYRLLEQAGITKMREASYYGLALPLGGMEVTMQELVQLYAMLANQGRLRSLKMLKQTPLKSDEPPLLSPEAAFITLDMLRHNPPPNPHNLPGTSSNRAPVAWKTGTSFAFRDAWAVAVSKEHVLAVWIGNFNGRGNPAFIGRTAAGPLLFSILDRLDRKTATATSFDPDPRLNLKQVAMCRETGDLPGRHCPHTTKGWFIPGVSPIRVSNVYRAIPIDIASGRRACFYDPQTSRMEVYEFWPSDLQRIFRQAGIMRRIPPPYLASCTLDQQGSRGLAPTITSPSEFLSYTRRLSQHEADPIPFEAVTDADVAMLYWFVDNRLVGESKSNEILLWPAESGQFHVSVIDDHGRSAEVKLKVEVVQ
ncbi:MAG: penicillin-binding protein 1C [Candidatus Thiodiazotropha sp.]|jgi:penicillin-binding protein 1C